MIKFSDLSKEAQRRVNKGDEEAMAPIFEAQGYRRVKLEEKMAKPRGQIIRSTEPKPAFHPILEPEITIAAWCPDSDAQESPEQVHFVIHLDDDVPPLVMRFKSPDSLGFFIEELARYRHYVWPDAEPVDTSGENV